MIEFFVGLLVLLMLLIFSIIGIFLLPFIVVLGIFMQGFICVALLIFAIWLVGKVTLMAIEHLKNK